METRKKNTPAAASPAAGGGGVGVCGAAAAYPLPSVNKACCRRGGRFLFLPKSCSLGRWRCFTNCWSLLLPPAFLLPVWSVLSLCWWFSVCLSVRGGLLSFRLIISSLMSLIFRSRTRFSSSFLFFIC